MHLCRESAAAHTHLRIFPGITVTAVAAGGAHTCAVTSTGGLWCWGSNFNGQLGIKGTVLQQNNPAEVSLGAGEHCLWKIFEKAKLLSGQMYYDF